MNEKELDEKIEKSNNRFASAQHDIWAHWMNYQFSKCTEDEEGNLIIPKELVDKWKKQSNNNYYELTEKEKQSDLDIVKRYLHDPVHLYAQKIAKPFYLSIFYKNIIDKFHLVEKDKWNDILEVAIKTTIEEIDKLQSKINIEL
tara:strand:+ start:18 stop:449 length:432 start_codon:yes stop_codon:yes gene_type:complete